MGDKNEREGKGKGFLGLFRRGKPADVPSRPETTELTPFKKFAEYGREHRLRDGRLRHEIKDGFLTARLEAKDNNGSVVSSDELIHEPITEGEDISRRLFVTTAILAQRLQGNPWIPMRDPDDPTRPLSGPDRDALADAMMDFGFEPFLIPGAIEPQTPQQTA